MVCFILEGQKSGKGFYSSRKGFHSSGKGFCFFKKSLKPTAYLEQINSQRIWQKSDSYLKPSKYPL